MEEDDNAASATSIGNFAVNRRLNGKLPKGQLQLISMIHRFQDSSVTLAASLSLSSLGRYQRAPLRPQSAAREPRTGPDTDGRQANPPPFSSERSSDWLAESFLDSRWGGTLN